MIKIVKRGAEKQLEPFDYDVSVEEGVQEVNSDRLQIDESYILRGEGVEIYDVAMSFMDFAKNYGYDIGKSLDKMDAFVHSYYVGKDVKGFKKTVVEGYTEFCDIICDELRIVLSDRGCPIK